MFLSRAFTRTLHKLPDPSTLPSTLPSALNLPNLSTLRRSLSLSPTLPLPSSSSRSSKVGKAGTALFAAGATCFAAHLAFGSAPDFYDYRFITDKDPDDLAGFYGSEAFMDIFCVVPFMGTLMMRGGTFDDEGTVHTTGFPG